MRQTRVLMIGLGRIGSKFYERFTALDESLVKIIAVSEPNMDNPLLADAHQRGIPNFPDFAQAISTYGEQIDIIMDTSNRAELKAAIRKQLYDTNNQHTVLMPLVGHYLMWYLMGDDEALPQSHHTHIGY